MKATVQAVTPLMDFLLKMFGNPSKATVRQKVKYGAVAVDGNVVRRTDIVLEPGQVVEISKVTKPVAEEKETVKTPGHIYHEDESIIIAHKPAGLLTMATDKEKELTLYSLLYSYMAAKQDGGRVFVVHRLDRNVAGLMVFAKTIEAKTDLQLNWDTTEKRYMALVEGRPPQPKGRIETWLEEIGPHKVRVCRESPEAKFSITEYETLKEMEGHTLLDINLLTGRRHQIRVHLAHLGCPIVGDRAYGTPIHGRTEVLLFSYFLRFRHPSTGKYVTFKIPVPKFYKSPPAPRFDLGHSPRPSKPSKGKGPRGGKPVGKLSRKSRR